MLSQSFVQEIERLQRSGIPFCVVTLVDGRGSIPQVVGARAVFTREGLRFGTVGGGRIEAKCEEAARRLLERDGAAGPCFRRWNLQTDVGMTCGGEVALYFEVWRPELEWRVVVFGAGHVAQKLCRFLAELDCRVTCIDTRPAWIERLPRTPRVAPVLVESYAEGVDRIADGAFVVLVTMGHGTDLPVLDAIAQSGRRIPYLAVIGSDSKARVLRRQLAAAGAPDDFIEAIVCPAGEDIGDNRPAEIAFSIVAEMLRLRTPAGGSREARRRRRRLERKTRRQDAEAG